VHLQERKVVTKLEPIGSHLDSPRVRVQQRIGKKATQERTEACELKPRRVEAEQDALGGSGRGLLRRRSRWWRRRGRRRRWGWR